MLRDDVGEAGENMPLLHFDPRQGTLLGFELPAEAFVSMTPRGQRAAGVPVGVTEGANLPGGSSALAEEKPVTAQKPIAEEKSVTAQAPIVAAGSPDGASPASERVPLLSPGAALASVRQQGARGPADAMRTAAKGTAAQAGAIPMSAGDSNRAGNSAQVLALPPAEQPAFTGGPEHETVQPFDGLDANALTQTVASRQAAFDQAQHAAQARWRRTRHGLALTLAVLALLLIVSVAQTVTLIGFVHRSEAAQQQVQSALSQQQAALASLASAIPALSARGQGAERSASPTDGAAPATTAPQPAKRATGAHARHTAERAKPAAH